MAGGTTIYGNLHIAGENMSGINITNCFGLGLLFSSPHRQMKKGCISLGGEDLICFNEHRNTGKIWNYVFLWGYHSRMEKRVDVFFWMFGVGGDLPTIMGSFINHHCAFWRLANQKNGVDDGLVVEHS